MSAYYQLSFVVTTSKTKGSAGFGSGLVSEINAHTARNTHARRRAAKDRANKSASIARGGYIVAATDFGHQALGKVIRDDKVDFHNDTEEACRSDGLMSPCKIPSASTQETPRFTSAHIDFSCVDASLRSMLCLPLVCSRKDVTLLQFCEYGNQIPQ